MPKTFDDDLVYSKSILDDCINIDDAISDNSKIKYDPKKGIHYICLEDDKKIVISENSINLELYKLKSKFIIKGIGLLIKMYSLIDKKDVISMKEISNILVDFSNRYPAETELVLLAHKRAKINNIESTAFLIYLNKNTKIDSMIKEKVRKDYQNVFNQELQDSMDNNFSTK